LNRWLKGTIAALIALTFAGAAPAMAAGKSKKGEAQPAAQKLDKILADRASKQPGGKSRVIIRLKPGWDVTSAVKGYGGVLGRNLGLINGKVALLSNGQLKKLAGHPGVESIHFDRPTGGSMNRTAVVVGARAVQAQMGYDGAGVGVAVIDSGITSWHDDLTYNGGNPAVQVVGNQRVAHFMDFVNGQTSPYDDNGHGTHVSGTIAGNGYNSSGRRAGIAPAAHIISLKVLDQQGAGYISDVIAALEYAVQHRAAYNIRVINLSVGAAVSESYLTDPLTLAAKQAVDAGIVVVTAAGNLGRNGAGQTQYGGITAPGNAPWVLTVGASSHQGTVWRNDDVIGGYSSRGPTAVDYLAKPDVVAPGTGTVSLSAPGSVMYLTKAAYLLRGTGLLGFKPYLSLTGTSMAAPVVSGTVALMLQANPNLTPNLVKAIIQYTAQQDPDYDALTQGAGFLNTRGAVELARYFATASAGQPYPSKRAWSRQILWGNHRLVGGVIKPNRNAWGLNIVWGTGQDDEGENIVWGTLCDDLDPDCENIVWGTSDENIVWGTDCDPAVDPDCENIVWGTDCDPAVDPDCENIVWGTSCDPADPDCENIVWGTTCDPEDPECENIVWGTDCEGADCENIVWGTSCDPLLDPTCDENIVWGTSEDIENIVWGSNGDVENIVWGTSSEADNVTWGCSGETTPLYEDPEAEPELIDADWESLFLDDGTDPAEPPDDVPPPVAEVTEAASDLLMDAVTSELGGL
jgi:serine protease AprX